MAPRPVAPPNSIRSRLTHTLDTRVGWTLRPLYRVLIKAHDTLVEDLLDKAERATGGRPSAAVPLPRVLKPPTPSRADSCGSRHEAPRHRAHLAALADPRARARLPARGRVGAADAGRAGRPRSARRAVRRPRRARVAERRRALRRRRRRPALDRQPRALRAALVASEVFDWDDGSRAATLRDRLPADLLETRGPDPRSVPFTSLYLTHDEWAAEIVNRTAHAVMHIGWVPDGAGGYRGQMAVLVKPNGCFGRAYMAAISPFRHLIVYPGADPEHRAALARCQGRANGPPNRVVESARRSSRLPPGRSPPIRSAS